MKILIGGAWPYANGSLHIGRLAALLPGDVLARYHRLKGDEVVFVSGSDCYGTPVAFRAQTEGVAPEEICGRYHREFSECFERLGFSYDRYGLTHEEGHRSFAEAFHCRLYQSPYVLEKTLKEAWCPACGRFLPDRFVKGICPVCGEEARGDQCDSCGKVLDAESLHAPVCSLCGQAARFRETKHLFIDLPTLREPLESFLAAHPGWRRNARTFTRRYLDEGLRQRALTRDLDWGVPVPREGYEDKRIYIWAENVLGYLSQSAQVCRERGLELKELWGENAKHYYIHGKDNIPFHTIILPALLIAHGGGWRLPDEIVSCEYLTLEGRKFSTSRGWVINTLDILERYHPDSVRYALLSGGPERRDADFSWEGFVHSHNSDLVGIWGNFVNRNLQFIEKYFGGCVPQGETPPEVREAIAAAFRQAGELIEKTRFREALAVLVDLARFGNRYFDAEKPWITRNTEPEACARTLHACVELIAALAVLLCPFLPFSCKSVLDRLGLKADKWEPIPVPGGTAVTPGGVLFDRLPPETVQQELARLPQREA
jgi:methionyl-tRNA synthetase